MNTHTRRSQAGFSFVELLVTIIIAGIAFAAMVPLFVQAQRVSSGDKMRAVALGVAQDRIEKLRQLDFEVITEEHLYNNTFYFGEFGDSWKEQTEAGQRTLKVAYMVTEKPVSATDTRIAYKVVTVRVYWEGPPYPHKDVVLTTMIYRQYSGPEIVDFAIPANELQLADQNDPDSEKMIYTSTVDLDASVNAADLDSMVPIVLGSTSNPRTIMGRVDYLVTSASGTAFPTISVNYDHRVNAQFPTTWTVPGGTPGYGDGYYSFKAVAFSTYGSPGNSWQLVYRVETGPPAPISALSGSAGLTSAGITWNASTTGDVDHYIVTRNGTEVANLPKAGGSMGYTDESLSGAAGVKYTYGVYAVDWMGKQSPTVTLDLTATDPASLVPQPATALQGTVFSSSARLQWVASPTAGVLGYQVYQRIGATENTFTTASATLDVPQPWNTTALYQVKPFVVGSILATSYASLAAGQASQDVSGVLWAQVALGAEPRYTLSITNTTNKALTSLRLFYLGPAGTDPQQEMLPAASNIAKNATQSWTDLAAGQYRWDWVTSNNRSGSQTAWCSGPSGSTIAGGTP